MEYTVLSWSRDWSKFDYMEEIRKFKAGEPISFTKESFVEFMQWARVYRPEIFLGWVIAELQGD